MPAFVPIIAIDLHELFQDSTVASRALGGKSCRIVEMAVYVVFMLVVRILRTKHGRTDRASKVFDVVFLVWTLVRRGISYVKI